MNLKNFILNSEIKCKLQKFVQTNRADMREVGAIEGAVAIPLKCVYGGGAGPFLSFHWLTISVDLYLATDISDPPPEGIKPK